MWFRRHESPQDKMDRYFRNALFAGVFSLITGGIGVGLALGEKINSYNADALSAACSVDPMPIDLDPTGVVRPAHQ